MSGNASVFHQAMKSNIPEKPAFVIDLSEEQKARMARDNEKMAERMRQVEIAATASRQQQRAFPLVESLAGKNNAGDPKQHAKQNERQENRQKDQQQASGLVASQPIDTGDMQLGPDAKAKKGANVATAKLTPKLASAAEAKTRATHDVSKTHQPMTHKTTPDTTHKTPSAPVSQAKAPAKTATPVKVATLSSKQSPATVKPSQKAKPSAPDAQKSAKNISSEDKKGWLIQVASFRKSANAAAMQKRLARHGMESSIVKNRSKSGMLYRVRIGPWSQKQAAAQQQAALEEIVGLNTLLVKNR